MKCINRNKRNRAGRAVGFICAMFLLTGSLAGCGRQTYSMAYQVDYDVSSFNMVARQEKRTAAPFAANLCVVTEDITDDENVDMSQAKAAGLFRLEDGTVLYAKNVHERLYPASITKVMTALVALENGSLNQVLTATDAVRITESGAVLCGLEPGDTMTLDQALRILLVWSANDAGLLIAENIGGSVEHFLEMMNEKARELGATNTNFANPHGLTDLNHYTTAYDLYLIFNEAIKYDTFNEIIHMSGYQTVFYDKNGGEKVFDKPSTNQFFRGNYQPPANVTVIGGKTGTTNEAGHCLMLLVRDENGSPYISVILGAQSRDTNYNEMIDLLDEIHK